MHLSMIWQAKSVGTHPASVIVNSMSAGKYLDHRDIISRNFFIP